MSLRSTTHSRTPIRRRVTLLAVPLLATLSLSACAISSDSSASENQSGDAANSEAPLYDKLPAEIQDAGTIEIGSAIDYPPFEYYEDGGKKLAGFEVELAEELEKQLGVSFTWNNAAFDSLLPALSAGRYDVMYGATNDTAEREADYDFVYYLQSSQGFVTAQGNAGTITTEDDLCGMTLAAVRGGVQALYLEEQSGVCEDGGNEPIEILTFGGNSEEQVAVKQGKADAMLENYPTAATFAEDSGGTLELAQLQVEKRYYGMVFTKDNTELRDVMVEAWQGIIDDGSYDKILKDWGLSGIGIDEAGVNAVESGVSPE